MESNGVMFFSLFILALAGLGVMSLGVICWKACRFLGDMLADRTKGDAPLTQAMKELPKESAQSITDGMNSVVRKQWQK